MIAKTNITLATPSAKPNWLTAGMPPNETMASNAITKASVAVATRQRVGKTETVGFVIVV
jgi:hypothetical protein